METDASEITAKVKDKEDTEFSSLFSRMDEDLEIWEMSTSPINTYDAGIRAKTKAHGSDIDIVSNEPRTFSDGVQAILSSAEMQIAVRVAETEGEDKREETGKLERLFYFLLEKADERLRRLVLPPLRETLIWYSLVLGWAATRVLIYKDGKNVISDIIGFNPRWLTYETGGEGLLWVAHKTFRSKSSLKSEYGYEAAKKTDNQVIDYWEFEEPGKISNAILCSDTFLKEPEVYDIPSMPILIMPISTRPPIADSTGTRLKGYGESIFAPIRNINAIRNRFASVVASHANLMANQALINYKTAMGRSIPSDAMFNVPGEIVELTMGENRLEPSPMKEISPTVVNMLNWLNDQMEQGMLPKIRGEQPQSGTRYQLEKEAGNRVFNPQLRNLNYFYADICHLIEEQLVTGGVSKEKIKKVKFQSQVKNKYYETEVTPVDLKKSHTIKVEFTAQTPWTQQDTYAVADMAKRLGVPEGYIWEYILKFQDPKGMADLRAVELYENSPKGAMLRAWVALMKQGRIDEAEQIKRDLSMLEMQELGVSSQQVTREMPEETPVRRETMPLAPPEEIPPEGIVTGSVPGGGI